MINRRRLTLAAALVCGLVLVGGVLFWQLQPAAKKPAPNTGIERVVFHPDKTTLTQCEGNVGSKEQAHCVEQAWGNRVLAVGPTKALFELDAYTKGNADRIAGCHHVVHKMGAAAYLLYDGDTGKALTETTTVCSSGYSHGVIERSLFGVADSEVNATTKKFCATTEDTSNQRNQCFHGLGHGLMMRSAYELPWSLRTCEAAALGGDRGACYSGAYMELYQGTYKSKYLRNEDLIYPCNSSAIPRSAVANCYNQMAARLASQLDGDLTKVGKVCEKVEAQYAYLCFEEWGNLTGEQAKFDPQKVATWCKLARPTGYEPWCWQGSALHAIDVHGDARIGARVCSAAPPHSVDRCWFGVGKKLIFTTEGTIKDIPITCSQLTQHPRFVRKCLDGMAPQPSRPPKPSELYRGIA